MGCNWVNYIARIDTHHSKILVICPTCGRWGTIHIQRKYTLYLHHNVGDKCATTWHTNFQRFAENVHGTVCRVNLANLKSQIRLGRYIVENYRYLDTVAPNNPAAAKG